MNNDDKKTFAKNLSDIHNKINWSALMLPTGSLAFEMPRMRIRKFDNCNKFTLVSDNKTRQQNENFNKVLNNNYKKYKFAESKEIGVDGTVADSVILVCKFDNGKISLAYNGKELPFNVVTNNPNFGNANPVFNLDWMNKFGNSYPYLYGTDLNSGK